MRKLCATLMITALMMPVAAWAVTPSADPTDPNNTIFTGLTATVKGIDSAGLPTVDPATGALGANQATNALGAALGRSDLRGAGCNPVVWAAMVQNAQRKIVQKVSTAGQIRKQIDLAKSNCMDLVGRTVFMQRVEKMSKLNTQAITAIAESIGAPVEAVQKIYDQIPFNPVAIAQSDMDRIIATQCQSVNAAQSNLVGNLTNTQLGGQMLNNADSKGVFSVNLPNATALPPSSTANGPNAGSYTASVSNPVRSEPSASVPQYAAPVQQYAAPPQPQYAAPPAAVAPRPAAPQSPPPKSIYN